MSEGMTVADLCRAAGGRLAQGDGRRPVRGAAIDSRGLRPGQAFFALRGTRTDGHRFVSRAAARGASCAVVERKVKAPRGLPLIRVPSVRAALRRGAAWHRRSFHLPVIGITGSNGKTTAKDLAAHVLGRLGPVLATRGNLNNDLGVPLTVFGLRPGHVTAVVEMAMNRPGEIGMLARLAEPTAGVVLNASLTHAWGFRNVHAIAREKAGLLEELPAGGWAFLNEGDREVWKTRGLTRARVLGFGVGRGTVRGEKVKLDRAGRVLFTLHTPSGRVPVRTRLLGAHNALNAVAAAAVGWAFGLSLRELAAGLGGFRPAGGMRMEVRKLGRGARGIVDCYNANPASCRAALDFLAATGVRSPVLVLGEMRELGAHSRRAHAETGRRAAALRPALLVGVGPGARPLVSAARAAGVRRAVWVGKALDAAREVRAALRPGVTALFKGSRAVGLERLAAAAGGRR